MSGLNGLLDGCTAVVTGGAGGLGQVIARTLQGAGARGSVLDLPATLDAAAPPPGWRVGAVDVTSETSVAQALAAVTAQLGQIDILVAATGVVPPWQSTENLDLDSWDRTMAVNARGVATTLKHARSRMRAPGGSIVALASLNSWRAHGQQSAYTASKHAVLGLVRAAALDLGRSGIRVNAVAPGPIETPALLTRMARRHADGGPTVAEALATAAEATALGRLATADEVADVVLFLAAPLSTAVTGQLLPVDAGIA